MNIPNSGIYTEYLQDNCQTVSYCEFGSSLQGDMQKITLKRQKHELTRQNKRLRLQYDEISTQYEKMSTERDTALKQIKILQDKLKDTNQFYKQQIINLKLQLKKKSIGNKYRSKNQKQNDCPNSLQNKHNQGQKIHKQLQRLNIQNISLKQSISYIMNNVEFSGKSSSTNFWKKLNSIKQQFNENTRDYPFGVLQRASTIIRQKQCNKDQDGNKLQHGINQLSHKIDNIHEQPYILKSNQKKTIQKLQTIFSSIQAQISSLAPKRLY